MFTAGIFPAAGIAAKLGHRLVVSDPIQPARKLPGVFQRSQTLVGLKKGLLTQIESILAIAGEAVKKVVQLLLPARYQDVIRLHVPTPGALHQFSVLDDPKEQWISDL